MLCVGDSHQVFHADSGQAREGRLNRATRNRSGADNAVGQDPEFHTIVADDDDLVQITQAALAEAENTLRSTTEESSANVDDAEDEGRRGRSEV